MVLTLVQNLIRVVSIEKQNTRADSRRIEGRAVHRATVRDHVVGRAGYAGVSACRSGRRSKNGDISATGCDRRTGCLRCGELNIRETKRIGRRLSLAGHGRAVYRWALTERTAELAGSAAHEMRPGIQAAGGKARSTPPRVICLTEKPPVS